MVILPVILFAFAVSLDGFGVGLSYGMRKINIPLASLLVICLTSTAAITFSMYFGTLVSGLVKPKLAERIGALILIMVGSWIFLQSLTHLRSETQREEAKPSSLVQLKISFLGIVIQILKEPVQADFDRSGVINLPEALILGFALAMDALGAGFGAAVAGYQTWLVPVFVGILKLILVPAGLKLGASWGETNLGKNGAVLPGLILIFLGMLRIK